MKMIAFLFLFYATKLQATTFSVPYGNISDHADASVTNSIAWFLQTYGAGHTYQLTSEAQYYIESSLKLPAGATLMSDNIKAQICAGSNLDSQVMIFLGSYSTLKNITMNAERTAAIGIDGQYTADVTIEDCSVVNTKNNFSTKIYPDTDSHLINIVGSTNAIVTGCTLKNAGCNPIENWESWGAATNNFGNGICAGRAINVLINDCSIDQTLGGSIAIARAEGVLIQRCRLSNSACINLVNNHAASQDSIIGYHNIDSPLRNVIICNNIITGYMGHGIHISGERLILTNNIIYNGCHNAIRLDDHRTPAEYTVDAFVAGNTLGLGSETNTFSRTYINHSQSEMMTMGINVRYEDDLPFIPGIGAMTSNIYARYETFNNEILDGWTSYSGTWSVNNGVLEQTATSATRQICWDNVIMTNGILQVYLNKDMSTSSWLGMCFRKNHPSDSPYVSGYMAFIRDNGDVTLYKAGQGALQTVSSGLNPQDIFFLRLTVKLTGSNIKVFINGKILIDQMDSTYPCGSVGLVSLGTVARFDSMGLRSDLED